MMTGPVSGQSELLNPEQTRQVSSGHADAERDRGEARNMAMAQLLQ
jgi:hypothetical protein